MTPAPAHSFVTATSKAYLGLSDKNDIAKAIVARLNWLVEAYCQKEQFETAPLGTIPEQWSNLGRTGRAFLAEGESRLFLSSEEASGCQFRVNVSQGLRGYPDGAYINVELRTNATDLLQFIEQEFTKLVGAIEFQTPFGKSPAPRVSGGTIKTLEVFKDLGVVLEALDGVHKHDRAYLEAFNLMDEYIARAQAAGAKLSAAKALAAR